MSIRLVVILAILTGPALVPFALADTTPTPVQAAPPRPTPAPANGEMSAGDVTKWLAFFDKLVVVVVKAQGEPCDKMAAEVSTLIDANQPAINIARNARATGKKLPPAAQERMVEGVKKMVPAMQKCGQHDKVRAAFAKLDLNRKG